MRWTVLAVALTAVACGRSPEDKVQGWPRTDSLWENPAPAQVPPAQPEATPTPVEASGAPDGQAAAQAHALDYEPLDAGPGSCKKLIERACEFLGVYSEECIEARSSVPVHPTPLQLQMCVEVYDDFEMSYNRPDSRRNPCRQLARNMCRDVGKNTETCTEARVAVRRLRKDELKRACKGDLLVWEAKKVFAK